MSKFVYVGIYIIIVLRLRTEMLIFANIDDVLIKINPVKRF